MSLAVILLLLAAGLVLPASAQTMDELIEGAKAEGMLTTIALPHSWCGYGDVIAGFKEKYPFLNINELNSAGNVRIHMANADQASNLAINSEINSADTARGVSDVA